MHPFETQISKTIDEHRLLRRGSPVIVALSGGADSVALLAVLTSLGYECIAAHCNFRLRDDESLRDMRHAEAVAARLGVNIYVREFDVKDRMRRTGESVEMACRELRYAWFHDLLDRDYSQAIAVAHHREDNVETFMLNLLRSSGLAGLTGMSYRRGYVVRPFLDVTRSRIETYLADRGIDYVNDSSNAANEYRRNRLRNLVLPILTENFEGATDAILASMRNLAESRLLIDHIVGEAARRFETPEHAVDIAALLNAYPEDVAPVLLYELLKPMGFNRTQTDNIADAVRRGSSGRTFRIDSRRRAELDRGILSLHRMGTHPTAIAPTETEVTLTRDIISPVNLLVTHHNVAEFRPERNPGVCYLDAKVLEGSEAVFTLRRPRRGDRMTPFGMTDSKLVSDILKDAKLTAAQKRDTWLLVRGDTILWIVGVRASAHFSVNPSTRRYLRVALAT